MALNNQAMPITFETPLEMTSPIDAPSPAEPGTIVIDKKPAVAADKTVLKVILTREKGETKLFMKSDIDWLILKKKTGERLYVGDSGLSPLESGKLIPCAYFKTTFNSAGFPAGQPYPYSNNRTTDLFYDGYLNANLILADNIQTGVTFYFPNQMLNIDGMKNVAISYRALARHLFLMFVKKSEVKVELTFKETL